MSHKVSNIFASRAFAEHPLALWPLDDELSFISLLDSNHKDILYWESVNGHESASVSSAKNVPLPDEISSIIIPISGSMSYMDFTSPNMEMTLLEDPEKSTVTISAHAYAFESAIDSIEIGFKYKDTEDVAYTYDTQEFTMNQKEWTRLTHTIDTKYNDEFRGYIKVNYTGSVINNDYALQINSLSIGQWSEVFFSDSTGVIPQNLTDAVLNSLLPTSPPLGIKVVNADPYGLLENKDAYYVVDNNKMLAVNYGLPMTFGSSNVTKIHKPITQGMPSIIFPGQGFLNKLGENKQVTAEFWLRVYTDSATPIKIFGPITSNDGLYIEEEFMTLRIGRYSKSHFVGKWFRPMLIHIRYTPDNISLLINGETVITIEIEQEFISLPFPREDWLGFYGNEDVYPFEIDCFGIYPYLISSQLAKKKYVYGQGVGNVENVINNFSGESVYIDFPFANYSSTINYPNMTGWNAGYFNNINATSKYLSFPEYTLPEIIYIGADLSIFNLSVEYRTWSNVNERTWEYWKNNDWQYMKIKSAADTFYDSLVLQDGDYAFIKLKPNEVYENVYGSIYYESMNPINSPVKSIFGVFRSPDVLTSTQEILMQFTSKINSNNFKIVVDENGLDYLYNDLSILNSPIALSASTDFVAGIEVDRINANYAAVLQNFFSSPQNISLNIGGYADNTFSGRIYSTTFNNRLYTNKDLLGYIQDNGVFDKDVDTYLMKYVGNYTYHVVKTEESLIPDIGCAGYWEDSLPLTYFAKFVKDVNGNDIYDLDMIQFNIDNSSPLITEGTLSQTEDTALKVTSYVTIQDYASVGKKLYTDYTNVEPIKQSRVLEIDNYTYGQIVNTKFEVVDGTIIFPPKEEVDFENYYLTTHIEIKTDGILNKSIKLKSLSYSSLAYDESAFHPINTRTGNKIYPFHKLDDAYIFKSRNPFRIYKDSTPYIHLTGDSGIQVLPYLQDGDRGLSIPINNQKAPQYTLGGIQFWLMYNKDYTIDNRTLIGRIVSSNKKLDIYLETESGGRRGKVKIYDTLTGIEQFDIIYYQNGYIVNNPVIEPLSWTSLVISFSNDIILDNHTAQFEVYEGFLFNNVAFFNESSTIFGNVVNARDWTDIQTRVIDVPGPEDSTESVPWSFWNTMNWRDAWLTEEIIYFTVNGEEIHQSLFGLAKATVKDDATLSLNSDSFKIVTNVNWNRYEGRVV